MMLKNLVLMNGKSRGFLISGGILAAFAALPFIGTIASIFLGGVAIAGSLWMINQVLYAALLTIGLLGGGVLCLFLGILSPWQKYTMTQQGIRSKRSYRPAFLIGMSFILFVVFIAMQQPNAGATAMSVGSLGGITEGISGQTMSLVAPGDFNSLNIFIPILIVCSIVSIIVIVMIMRNKKPKKKRRKKTKKRKKKR